MSSSNSLFSTTGTLGNLNVNSGLTVPLNKTPIAKAADFTAEVGNTYLITKPSGDCAVTLPTAINNGDQINLVCGGSGTGAFTITAPEAISGYLFIIDGVDGTASQAQSFVPDGTDTICTLDNTTKGENGIINLCVVNGSWSYSGQLQGADSLANPFS